MRSLLSRRAEPSRRTRRIIVAASIVGIPLVALTPAIAAPLRLSKDLWVVAAIAVLIPLWVLSEYRRGIVRRDTADERERQRRNDAYRISYRIIEWSIPFVALGVVFRDPIAFVIGGDWWLLYLVTYGYVAFLPYMVFAWREPDAVD